MWAIQHLYGGVFVHRTIVLSYYRTMVRNGKNFVIDARDGHGTNCSTSRLAVNPKMRCPKRVIYLFIINLHYPIIRWSKLAVIKLHLNKLAYN